VVSDTETEKGIYMTFDPKFTVGQTVEAKEYGSTIAPEYAKYHLATYGNDYRFLHNL
jgi:hypothetical protein